MASVDVNVYRHDGIALLRSLGVNECWLADPIRLLISRNPGQTALCSTILEEKRQ